MYESLFRNMPGFFITNQAAEIKLKNNCRGHYVFDSLAYDEFCVKRATQDKFIHDKCFSEDHDYIIIEEGVLLNKQGLYQKYGTDNVKDMIVCSFKENGEDFFGEFRGSFSGAIYIKQQQKWIVYTNQFGDNTVFYHFDKSAIIIGSQFNYVLNTLKALGDSVSPDPDAINSILTYGFMADDYTYVQEIKRLLPGHYMVIRNKQIDIKQYFSFVPAVYDLAETSEAEIIEEIDKRFRAAIKLEYDKDLEYGYRHLNQLSGGLDSRMNIWVARNMGYSGMLCMTFAQTNSLDETVAKQIAKKLNTEIFFWPLDTAGHLKHIDEYIAINYGLALYGGVGAAKEIYDCLDMQRFGLVHTGQLGDVVLGSYIRSIEEVNDLSVGGMYSTMLGTQSNNDKYHNREEYLMTVRGFLGMLSSHLFVRDYTEVASPFLDVDFFTYCMSIPVELRIDHHIYKKWILEKYPEAAEYIWEKIGRKITEPNNLTSKIKRAINDPKLVLQKLGLKRPESGKLYKGMNPMDLWWENDPELRMIYDQYYQDMINCEVPGLSGDIINKISQIYNKGTMIEKMLAITALAIIKYCFGDYIIDKKTSKQERME